MLINTKTHEGKMRVVTRLGVSLFVAIVSYCPLAAADVRDSPNAQSARYVHAKKPRSVHAHGSHMAIKNGSAVRPAIPEPPNGPQNLTWKTHALPKGNWIFTRFGINGTYPDNYP